MNILKKIFILLFISTSLKASINYAIVDAALIMENLPQREKVAKQLRQEFQPRIDELNKIQEKMIQINTRLQKDGALMSTTESTNLQRELAELDVSIKLKSRALQEDQQKRSLEENQKLVVVVQGAIKNIAKKHKYDLIVAKQAALFYDEKLDISDLVIKELSK